MLIQLLPIGIVWFLIGNVNPGYVFCVTCARVIAAFASTRAFYVCGNPVCSYFAEMTANPYLANTLPDSSVRRKSKKVLAAALFALALMSAPG